MYEFNSKEEVIEFLELNDFHGLDSEWSVQSRELVKKFSAKEIDVNRWWVLTSTNWCCPCCKRTKPEIVRLNSHGHLKGEIHEHHDHVIDAVTHEFTRASENLPKVLADESARKFYKRIEAGFSAYDNTLVCSDCNEADAKAKKMLKFKIGSYFSFSPGEIAQFIIVHPNIPHKIDIEVARRAWISAKPMFEKRLELIKQIAYLAATNSHWYQPSEKTARHEKRQGEHLFKYYGLTKVSSSGPEGLLYRTNKHQGDPDSWRRKKNLPDLAPTEGQVRHMAVLEYGNFDDYSDDWQCAICHRAKFNCVRKVKSGKWAFSVTPRTTRVNKLKHVEFEMCKDCSDVSISIGIEVKKRSGGLENTTLSRLIDRSDLASIVIPSSHCKHNINNALADKVVEALVTRAKQGEFE